MADTIIQESSNAYVEGVLASNPDTDVTLSANNRIYRVGKIGFLRLVATFPETTGIKTRILYTSSTIKPKILVTINVVFYDNPNQVVSGYLDISPEGTISMTTSNSIANQIIRELIVFPVA